MTAPRLLPARISLVLMLLILAASSHLAARMLVAELQGALVRVELDNWMSAPEQLSPAVWQRARERLETASHLSPRNALYAQHEGLLHEWRGFAGDKHRPSAEIQLMARRDAVIAYRKAARLRPSLASSWAHLARQKLLAGEPDDEFRRALHAASVYGEQQDTIHLEILYIAALGWRSFVTDQALFERVTVHLGKSLAQGDQQSGKLGLLRDGGLLEFLCSEEAASRAELPSDLRDKCQPGPSPTL